MQNKYFKVMITQIIKKEVVGKSVLVEDYDKIHDAIHAADEYSKVYDHQVYQIREYDNEKSNVISFDDLDTGKIVYENIEELMEVYRNGNVEIVELLDCILDDVEDELHIVAMNISDNGLTRVLDRAGADNWYCKGHKLFEK